VSKPRRYGSYFSSSGGQSNGTWYERAFPDGFEPRLLFLVHSAERRERVRRAVASEFGDGLETARLAEKESSGDVTCS
jgi:hypothetical protein